jgi:hypothetical protein
MLYFEGLKSSADLKLRYRDLAKIYHPDRGGCSETMKIINDQYKKCLNGAYQSEGKSLTEIENLLKDDVLAMGVLNSILHLENICVELVGCWIWVTGDTKHVKDSLKSAHFKWARMKKAWYWRPGDQKFRRWGKQFSLDEIRYKHGSERINKSNRLSIK